MPPPALIAELKRLHESRTPRRWQYYHHEYAESVGHFVSLDDVGDKWHGRRGEFTHESDARFAAAAANAAMPLIAALESAEAENVELRKRVEELAGKVNRLSDARPLLERAADFLDVREFSENDLKYDIDHWLAKHKETRT